MQHGGVIDASAGVEAPFVAGTTSDAPMDMGADIEIPADLPLNLQPDVFAQADVPSTTELGPETFDASATPLDVYGGGVQTMSCSPDRYLCVHCAESAAQPAGACLLPAQGLVDGTGLQFANESRSLVVTVPGGALTIAISIVATFLS